MPSPRFFCPQELVSGALVALPENAGRHAARVLRLKAGDDLVLFDGRGGEYAGRIEAVRRDEVTVAVGEWRDIERESGLRLRLVQALQSGDRMDVTVQKAVELGVAEIQPVSSRRSVVRLDGERAAKRLGHWRGVAASACEQCGRNRVPVVAPVADLDEWLARPAAGGLRLMLSPWAEGGLDALSPAAEIDLLIGAEGGLAPAEVERAAAAGFIGVRLGPRVLRTETAGMAALAAIQMLWGDFQGGNHHVRIG